MSLAKAKNLRKRIEETVKSKRMDNERKLRFLKRLIPKLRREGYAVEVCLGKEGKRGKISAMHRIKTFSWR